MSALKSRVTETGGRNATTRHIPPNLALAVGMPSVPAPNGWCWAPLTKLARLESGHTPSRKHPEYWDGDVPWIGIQDAKFNNGAYIQDTQQKITKLGIENSSARVLPENTVCLSRTASVGYVVVMSRPMATSQDFVNWVCSEQLDPNFLKYLFIAEGEGLLRFASGAVHQTIYFPEAKAFHICYPSLSEQKRIVSILDEAFANIAIAKSNVEKNLQNARELFGSYLRNALIKCDKGWVESTIGQCVRFIDYRGKSPKKTESGLRLITAKNVKMGYLQEAPEEFVAPESYDAWMTRGIPRRGDVLFTTEAPLANVAQLDTDEKVVFAQRIIVMQSDVSKLDNAFLKYILLSQPVQQGILSKATGATVQGIKARLLKRIEISFPSSIVLQQQIVENIDTLREDTKSLVSIYQQKLTALDELKKSLLHQAFTGELTKQLHHAVIIPFPVTIPDITTTDLHAGILARSYQFHEERGKLKYFGHVKAEKIIHMVEAYVGIDLGRNPVKEAAGPNDFPHLKSVEYRAKMAGFFDFQRVDGGAYRVTKRPVFERLVERVYEKLGDRNRDVDSLLELMVPMDTQQAEIFCTVYAAWNNLLLDQQEITDDDIVFEARENWHEAKLKIPREKFFAAITWMKTKGIVPEGRGKKVVTKVKKNERSRNKSRAH